MQLKESGCWGRQWGEGERKGGKQAHLDYQKLWREYSAKSFIMQNSTAGNTNPKIGKRSNPLENLLAPDRDQKKIAENDEGTRRRPGGGQPESVSHAQKQKKEEERGKKGRSRHTANNI